MQYTAHALTLASRPITITIGRASSRRGLRRLSAWWLRVARTWQARPISTPQMLALQAVALDRPRYRGELARVLRVVLPWRWWFILTGDPVREILRLGQQAPALQALVIRELVTVPGSSRDESRVPDEDPVAVLRRNQRRVAYGETGRSTPSLAAAAMTVRAAYGDAWYYAPHRWPTSDGYAPFALTWLEFVGLKALEARRRLEIADGYAIAGAKDPRRVRHALEKTAYPTEVH